jgi:hypothetical protein
VVGIGWYDAVQWAKLKQVAVDPERLDDTHEDWQRTAERTERELARDGGLVIRRVPIDVDALVAWCRERGKPVDGPARSAYAAEMVLRLGPSGE